jgi:hypothetical protein
MSAGVVPGHVREGWNGADVRVPFRRLGNRDGG